jgi:Holliday junction resolvase
VNTKAKGSRHERRSKALLEASGYSVTRAAASFGVFDLVGVGSTDFVLCHVKTRDWPSAVEVEGIRGFRCPANCRKLVHRWRDRERLPDVREIV